jgi:hypothetical protein
LDAPQCPDFASGHCPRGLKCKLRHSLGRLSGSVGSGNGAVAKEKMGPELALGQLSEVTNRPNRVTIREPNLFQCGLEVGSDNHSSPRAIVPSSSVPTGRSYGGWRKVSKRALSSGVAPALSDDDANSVGNDSSSEAGKDLTEQFSPVIFRPRFLLELG